jgi:hypothetical protein
MSLEKPIKNQLYFDFAHDSHREKAATAHNPARKKKNTAAPALAAVNQPAEFGAGLRDLCLLLHAIAQKYVSSTNFHDFNLVARCTKLLQSFDVAVEAPAEMRAAVADQEVALVLSAPEYRLLRSRAMAGLATVADLAARLPAKGSAEYQRGMREAYQHASDVAIMFLDDLERFQTRTSKPW